MELNINMHSCPFLCLKTCFGLFTRSLIDQNKRFIIIYNAKFIWSNIFYKSLNTSKKDSSFLISILFLQFEILEELRRERIDELATLIQKTYRGHVNRQKWHRLRGSQVSLSYCRIRYCVAWKLTRPYFYCNLVSLLN